MTPPPERLTQRDRQKHSTRESLRLAALDLFAERGFRETTADEIAAAAGVSRRTFFLHFSSKDEVLLGHIREHLVLLDEELTQAPAELDPVRRAGHALAQVAAVMQGRDDFLLQLDLLHHAPELLAINLQQLTAFETVITEAVRGWLAEGGTRRPTRADDEFAELVGTATIGALRAATNVWRRRGGRGQLHELVLRQTQRLADGLPAPERSQRPPLRRA